MIISIGNDLVSITEVRENFLNDKLFMVRVFCLSEQIYCEQGEDMYQRYAGCYAAKKAVLKALGLGATNKEVQWTHIKTLHHPSGKPELMLFNQAKKHADSLNVQTIHVSLSYLEDYASAFVVFDS